MSASVHWHTSTNFLSRLCELETALHRFIPAVTRCKNGLQWQVSI